MVCYVVIDTLVQLKDTKIIWRHWRRKWKKINFDFSVETDFQKKKKDPIFKRQPSKNSFCIFQVERTSRPVWAGVMISRRTA